MKLRLLAAGLFASLPGVAGAQGGQTIDSAQTFLVTVLPSAQMRLDGGDVEGWDNWGDIQTFEKNGECGFIFAAYHEPSTDCSEVRVAYSDVAIVDYYLLTSESMALRVANAMDFLRMNCDVSASTGF